MSDPGGVVGMSPLSAHTLDCGMTNGDDTASANGAFFVLPVKVESSAIPVFEALYPIFLSRKSTFCSCDAGSIFYLVYVVVYDIAVIETPESNFHLIRIRYGFEAFDDDSVPNTHLNVPLDPFIIVPEAHPASEDVGTPAPRYAENIVAQPFVPDKDAIHAELLGMHTKQPP